MSTDHMPTSRSETTAAEFDQLFPLSLAPFERFLLQDERPGYPMTFAVELVFLGRMNPEALAEAIGQAADRHPLLLARVETERGVPKWVLPADRRVPIDWQDPALPYAPPRGTAIDLRQESGLRAWIRADAERTSVTFQFHHACCDGEGSRVFGHDFMTAYTRLTATGERPDWTRIDYEPLRRRANFTLPKSDEPPVTTSLWEKVRDAYRFHMLAPAPLATRQPPATTSSSDPPRPFTIKQLFDRDQAARIEEQGTRTQCRLNDVAIALLFRTLADWNNRYSRAPARQRIRVLMPTDMRDHGDRRLTAANRVGFSFLTRPIEHCASWPDLLAGVAQETGHIKRIRLGLDFINVMGSLQRLPGVLPALLRLPRCMATAVLTNLGETTRRFRRRFPMRGDYPVIGDVLLEQVVGAPPLRPATRAGFGICWCSGIIAVSLRPDPAYLSPQDADELLNAYVDAWKAWAEL